MCNHPRHHRQYRERPQSRHGGAPQAPSVALTAVLRPKRTRLTAEASPITDEDVAAVAEFLRTNLNDRVPWTLACATVPWKIDAPNHGFMLRDGNRVVGVLLALYSERLVAGRTRFLGDGFVPFLGIGKYCINIKNHTAKGVLSMLQHLPQMIFGVRFQHYLQPLINY